MSERLRTIIILGLILSGGLFLRVFQLGTQSYWMDEGYTVNAVISQQENGTRAFAATLDSGDRYFCPIYCYPTAVISDALGQNPFSYRILSALFGVLAVVVVYFTTKIIFEKKNAALLAAFFTSFSYWQIAWSRQARWYTMLEVFFWIALLAFYIFLQKAKTQKQQIIALTIAALSAILAMLAHSLAFLLPVIMLVWFVNTKDVFKKIPSFKSSLPFLIAFVFLAAIGLGLQKDFIVRTFQSFTFNNHVLQYVGFYLRSYWPLLSLAIVGYVISSEEQKKKLSLLAFPFFLYLILLATMTSLVHYRYLFHLTPVILICAAVGAIDSLAKIPQPLARKALFIAFLVAFFLLGKGVLKPAAFYSLEADNPAAQNRSYYAYTPQPDLTAAYAAIKERARPEDVVISSQPQFNKIFLGQAGYWLAYDYLGGGRVVTETHEHYVNAEVIANLPQLQDIMGAQHGFIVFDYMSTDGRLPAETIAYIRTHSELIFQDEINSYSQIWVYRF